METTSVEGFVQLLACNLLPHGYWFYVTGRIPVEKDPLLVDRKLTQKYAASISRAARARRKQLGQANVRYVRHDRFFVLLATKGRHPFFEEEKASLRDIRHVPLRYAGYSISYRRGGRARDGGADGKWHAHVAIAQEPFRELQAYWVEQATRWSARRFALEFYGLPFEPYAPVRRQLLRLLRDVNRVRKRAGKKPIPYAVLPLRRRIVRPFDPATPVADSSPVRTQVARHCSGYDFSQNPGRKLR